KQILLSDVQPSPDYVLKETRAYTGVLCGPLPKPQDMLPAILAQAQSHDKQMALEFYAVDKYRNEVKPSEVPLQKLPHLVRRSLHKMPAYAGFLYAVTLDESLNRLLIIAARYAKDHILHYRAPHALGIPESLKRFQRNLLIALTP